MWNFAEYWHTTTVWDMVVRGCASMSVRSKRGVEVSCGCVIPLEAAAGRFSVKELDEATRSAFVQEKEVPRGLVRTICLGRQC